jgi:single-strand DNA-binding protein
MSSGDTTLTVVGNLTADPELRYTSSGHAVASFTVAASRRVYDQASGQWRDGDTLFLRCSAWRQLADHAAASLTRGTRVLVTGRLKQREYETAEGQKRTVYEVDVEDLGPSLKYATANLTKVTRDRVPHPAEAADSSGGGAGTHGAAPADSWSIAPQAASAVVGPAPDLSADRPPY